MAALVNCQQCGDRAATVHVTEIVDGRPAETHLCRTCARDRVGFEVARPLECPDCGAFVQPLRPSILTEARTELKCGECGSVVAVYQTDQKSGALRSIVRVRRRKSS